MIAKSACAGCRDDFYNGQSEKGCWSRESAEVITRWRIHYMTPVVEPGAFSEVKRPSCYSTPNSYVYFNKLPPNAVGPKRAKP